jgi:hypothetical protein
VAEHLGINADLVILGVVLINGEVILAEELQQGAEVLGGEVEAACSRLSSLRAQKQTRKCSTRTNRPPFR